MSYKTIIIVAGEPNSIFLEIFFKSLKTKIKSPLILIASKNLVISQMHKLKFKKKLRLIDYKKFSKYKLDNKSINLINVDYKQIKTFERISKKSNKYINNCFDIAFKIINDGHSHKFINGPISKKNYLKNKYLGITELISKNIILNQVQC